MPTTSTTASSAPVASVDPRGLRFAAAVTAVLLTAALLTVPTVPVAATVLLAVQALVFAVGALLGVRFSPYGQVFARVIRPRLAPPEALEDARPPQFAQAVGLVFALVALAALGLDATTVALVATGFALVAALLNAVVGFCLGCEIYLLVRRLAPNPA